MHRTIKLTELEKKIQQVLLAVSSSIAATSNVSTAETVKAPQLRIAGGWVRDKLLGLESNDIDIAIDNMNGEPFAQHVKNYMISNGFKMGNIAKINLNPEKSKHLETATAQIFGLDVDFVNLRSETYQEDSRNPEIEFGTPLQDALRRDITINALFYNLHTDQVEDHTGCGLKDLQDGIIRTPLPPLQTFLDDPLRVLRVIRFASRFNYELSEDILEASTDSSLRGAFHRKISRERVGVEVEKMLKGPNPNRALHIIEAFGFYDLVFEVPRELIAANSSCASSATNLCELLSG
jgi:tRNA nucleotidyltransferase (CCA-adding enzyme)